MEGWPIAKVTARIRPETNTLYLDFHFRGVRRREQTVLKDTTENLKRLEVLAKRIGKEIGNSTFDYAAHFPNSPRAEQVATDRDVLTAALQHALPPKAATVATPAFAEFSILWRSEMAPQWRRLHRDSGDAIFVAHLLPSFGDKPVAAITKADILAFRARLATLPERGNKHLTISSINKIIGILRQCLTEACERHSLPDTLTGINTLCRPFGDRTRVPRQRKWMRLL